MADDQADRHIAESLVRRAQTGDAAAFGELYEACYDRIYRYVAFKCGSRMEAEDLTSDVFLKMIESIGKFRFQGYPFTSWLYRIAHNVVVDHFRRKGRRPTTTLDAARHATDGSHADMERIAEIGWSMRQVSDAMESLTDLQREVITLRFAAGLSIMETAQVVGRRQNAVKSLQHAGIRKLRRAMAPPEPARSAAPEPETR